MTPTLTPPVSLEEANLLAQALDLLASGPCLTSAESPVDLIVNGRRMARTSPKRPTVALTTAVQP